RSRPRSAHLDVPLCPPKEGDVCWGNTSYIFFCARHLAKTAFICLSKVFAAPCGVILSWATSANIWGMRNLLKTSSTAAFEKPGCPTFVVYFWAIVVKIVYLASGLCLFFSA